MGIGIDSMRRAEEQMFRNLDRKRDYTENSEFNKLIQEWRDTRPSPTDFTDIYDAEEIRRDQGIVNRVKKQDDFNQNKRLSEISIEYALMEGIYNGWLGEEVSVVPASEYDDYANHVDFVMCIPGKTEAETYYIGVDATTGNHLPGLEKKLTYTTRNLKKNSLNRVKYFIDDQNPNQKGSIELPRVVIGLDNNKANALMQSMAANRNYDLEETTKGELTQEIEIQLVKAVDYLVRRFFSQSARKLTTAIEAIAFFKEHEQEIKQKDSKLYDNLTKQIGALEYFQALDNKKSPHSTSGSGGGGTFLNFLTHGRTTAFS